MSKRKTAPTVALRNYLEHEWLTLAEVSKRMAKDLGCVLPVAAVRRAVGALPDARLSPDGLSVRLVVTADSPSVKP